MKDAASAPKAGASVGRAAFDRLEQDFGTAKQEQTLRTEFRVTNEGDSPLEVTDLRADCGCAAATMDSRHLEPGASVAIKVTFRTMAATGKLVKRIRVSTNDPAHALVELLLKVDVSAGIVVDPSLFAFGDVPVGTAPSKTLRVQWKEGVGKPFKLTAVEALVADVRLETKPFDAPPWHGFEVTASFVKPPRIGVVSGMALLRTDDPDYPRITAALQAFVSGKIWVDRRTVSLGWIPAGKGRATAIVCRGFTPDVDLGDIKAKSRKGRVEAVPTRSGKDWIVTIKIPEDAAPGRIDDVIELTCSLPGEPPAEVTVTAYVNAAGGK